MPGSGLKKSAFSLMKISTMWAFRRMLRSWIWWFIRGRSTLPRGSGMLQVAVDKEGDEGSKFYFDYLKRKIVSDRVLDLYG